MRLRVAGLGPDPDAPLIAVERRAALLPLYTATTIVAGIGLLVLVTLFGTLPETIALPGVADRWAGVAGIAVWTVFGLAGSMKVVRGPSGHGVLTFHLPFIVAAMVLGGPIAGGWVAFIASFERRELREAPWYGILANHAGLALAAILGGVAAQAAVAAASGLGLPGGLAVTLLGAVVGTLVLSVVQTALAAGVIVLRDGLTLRETLHVFDRSFRGTLLAETILGWVFVVTWVAVGWWAPAVCAALVLALWRTNAAEAERDRDELTGLLTAGRSRRGSPRRRSVAAAGSRARPTCSSTSTGSSRSTTGLGRTRWATRCWQPSGSGCAARSGSPTRRAAAVVTSSCCCSSGSATRRPPCPSPSGSTGS